MGRRVMPMAGPSASQVNGDDRNVPPSTITALVQHQSRAKTSGPQDGSDQAAILELLQDIRSNPQEHLTDDPGVHCVLIHALIQVMAGICSDNNASPGPTVELSYAAACIEGIEIAISRMPRVLFFTISQGSGNGSLLCLWMLPQILSMVKSSRDASLQDRLQALLTLCLKAISGSFRHRDLLHRLQRFYQICVDDLIGSLNTRSAGQNAHDGAYFRLPSIEARAALTGQNDPPVVVLVEDDCQLRLTSSSHRIDAALGLLLALSSRSNDSKTVRPGESRRKVSDAWLAEKAKYLWGAICSMSAEAPGPKGSNLSTKFFDFVCTAVSRSSTDTTTFAVVITQALTQYFSSATTSSFESPPDTIIRLLVHLTSLVAIQMPSATPSEPLQAALTSFLDARPQYNETCRRALDDLLKVLTSHKVHRISQEQSASGHRSLKGAKSHGAPAVSNGTVPQGDHPTKRRKTEALNASPVQACPSSANELLSAFCAHLGNWDRSNLSGLRRAVAGVFSDLSEIQQKVVLKILIRLPTAKGKTWKDDEWHSLHGIICALLESKDTPRTKDHRVMMAAAVRSFTGRTTQTSHLDLSKSVMGKWCLQGLRSSVRQLRMLSAITLSNFMSHSFSESMCRHNRMIVLDVLRQLTDLADNKLAEALIAGFGQVALVCEEDERAIALNHLVEYLGHSSKLICDVAFLELKDITQALGYKSSLELLEPYWKIIGTTVVKDLLTRPQKTQQVADLVGLRIDQLLLHIQSEILPWLILEKKKDVLVRLAKARSADISIPTFCLQRGRNMTAILSAIIVQHPDEIEAAIASCLAHAGFDTDDMSPLDLLRVDAIAVACEVLKLAGDRTGVDREKAAHGFREFAVFIEKRGHQARAASTQARMSASFFENHALGIMNSLSGIIDGEQNSISDKKRCLGAIEQMIVAGQTNVAVALPQIRACLQSAMDVAQLKDLAFTAWSALIPALGEADELDGLIEQTFAAIVQHWDTFSPDVQQRGYDLVSSLVKQHSDTVQRLIASIPSLKSITVMTKTEGELARFRDKIDVDVRLQAFTRRCRDESTTVVLQALRELAEYLAANQQWLHLSAVAEHPHATISGMVRSLLDVCVTHHDYNEEILELSAKCIGVIGCLDPNRVETVRDRREMVVLSNFDEQPEAVDFVTYLMEELLVKAFHSVTNPKAQGFLGYVMQELLRFCGFDKEAASPYRPQGSQKDEGYQRWMQMSERARSTLAPFLSSHYVVTAQTAPGSKIQSYPIFSRAKSHGHWLRDFVLDTLQRPKGDNATQVFSALSRVIRGYDISIAAFILPFAFTNVVLGGTEKEAEDLGTELLTVLQWSTSSSSPTQADMIKSASQNVFDVLDYLSRFVQAKRKVLSSARSMAARTARPMPEIEEQTFMSQVACIERMLSRIPAQVISNRAVECGSYARALFHWEQHMRTLKLEATRPQSEPVDEEKLYQQLQDIYGQIDEPDGVEGISAYLHVLTPEQQVLEHRRAGRWAAAQSWYEIRLRDEPDDLDLHIDLLQCLKHAGQHQLLLDHANSLSLTHRQDNRVMSVMSEAAWSTQNMDALALLSAHDAACSSSDFSLGLGTALVALQGGEASTFTDMIRTLRISVAKSMSYSATASLQRCHDQLLKLHTLYEVEVLGGVGTQDVQPEASMRKLLDQRLNVLGSYIPDKQYLLAIRRSTMSVSDLNITDGQIASTWMSSAKLARKERWSNIAYEAVLNAAELGDETTKVEQAKLLWSDGEHNKAIRSIETAITMNAFNSAAGTATNSTSTSFSTAAVLTNGTAANNRDPKQPEQNMVLAKAHLLLARWLDGAGQTQSNVINQRYQHATRAFTRWEKGLYFLGRFYNKLLESEKALPPSKQNHAYLSGETAKLVIENFLRSLVFGCKYLFESVPKLLTLWLDFGIEISRPISKEVGDDVRQRAHGAREKMLDTMNKQLRKYLEKLPAYIFYPSLAQMVTRMGHPHKQVYELLAFTIIKVVSAHPQQGLWPLLAVVKSTTQDRAGRANNLIGELMKKGKNVRSEGQTIDLRSLINQGQKLSNALLLACEANIAGRSSMISLTRDLGFNAKVAPCPLVVPVDQHLSASLPMTAKSNKVIKGHKAFPSSKDAVTISSFEDDVLVLNSLQRPRKLTVRGSDGLKYGLLCKPNDDLRKDQRLMEFNAMINRGLKKDAESSKRQLYIRTYAVTPLNEACGLIEWVEGLKPMRDILLNSYRSRGTKVDYNLLREMLQEACTKDERIFSEQIIAMYEPVLHEWFTEHFADPESWFGARLRYARSAAVTSMQGYVLGLGDRHGENVLLEESNGGVFHVDFNCLFEKGLTFDKPELVPFRLTHNMVDACGAYGVEGPFRRSAECSMKVMRANEDALLTILETFVYDPTADFVGARKRPVKGVPETPKEVLESVRSKLRGLLRGESVPLSVAGHVDALIKQATDPKNLCAMYIGWCAFL